MTELEKKQDSLLNEYRKLISLSNSKEFFNIPSVNQLEAEIAVLKQQGEKPKRNNYKCSNCGKSLYDCDSSCFYKDDEIGEVTDEMIEKWADEIDFREYKSFWDAYISGAMAMRNKEIVKKGEGENLVEYPIFNTK